VERASQQSKWPRDLAGARNNGVDQMGVVGQNLNRGNRSDQNEDRHHRHPAITNGGSDRVDASALSAAKFAKLCTTKTKPFK
jgi:hypothetical protein